MAVVFFAEQTARRRQSWRGTGKIIVPWENFGGLARNWTGVQGFAGFHPPL